MNRVLLGANVVLLAAFVWDAIVCRNLVDEYSASILIFAFTTLGAMSAALVLWPRPLDSGLVYVAVFRAAGGIFYSGQLFLLVVLAFVSAVVVFFSAWRVRRSVQRALDQL
jgi:hypothetical protein